MASQHLPVTDVTPEFPEPIDGSEANTIEKCRRLLAPELDFGSGEGEASMLRKEELHRPRGSYSGSKKGSEGPRKTWRVLPSIIPVSDQ